MRTAARSFLEHRHRITWLVIVVNAASVGALGVGLAYDFHLQSEGRADLVAPAAVALVFVLMVLSTSFVGSSIATRRSEHPVGWLLLGLGFAVAVAVPIDVYSLEGMVVSPGSLPAADAVAVIGSLIFVPWLVLVAALLQLTPTGHPLNTRFRRVLQASVVAGVVTVAAGLLSDRRLDHPYEAVRNPMVAGPLAGPLRVIGTIAVSLLGIGVLAAVWSLILRFRRAEGVERLQLLWLAFVAVPMPVLLAGAFVTAWSGSEVGPLMFTAPIIVLLPLGAGLGVSRYRLYDVERLLGRVLTHALLTGLLVCVFVVTTVSIGAALGGNQAGSPVAVSLATVAAVATFTPGRRVLQDRLDRRFDRRRYNALSVLQRHLDATTPIIDLTAVLRESLGDETLEVVFPVDTGDPPQRQWVTADGHSNNTAPAGDEVRRGSRVIARVSYDTGRVDRRVADTVLAAAVTELDNAALRAELAVRLVEVRQSRSRLVGAQHEERRRIERNLHDGAQQRLLALAMQLQAAVVNGNDQRLREAASLAIAEAQRAVTDLRELANGLRPSVLADGGLAAALEDLAQHSTASITVTASAHRLDAEVEETAWFIVSEALANVHKHAHASHVDITACLDQAVLELTVVDDGHGGADSSGRGLKGLQDRAEAVGGTLRIRSDDRGTRIEARLPCGS